MKWKQSVTLLSTSFLVLVGQRVAGDIVFQTATSGPTGQSSGQGLGISDTGFTGVNFQVTSTVTVRSIGAHISDFSTDEPIFGAIVQLTGPNDFPNAPDLTSSDVLGATLIYPPSPSDNVVGHLRLTLTPGWYALLFGSGRFGATGEAGAWLNNTPVGDTQTYSILQPSGQIVFQVDGCRFFVDTDPLPAFRRIGRSALTMIPNSTTTFTSFSFPALSDGYVAFRGNGPMATDHQQGIYRWSNGIIEKVANRATLIPGGTGTFTSFHNWPQTSGGEVSFFGSGTMNQQGLYRGFPDGLSRIVDKNIAIPDGTGNFQTLGFYATMEEGQVAFTGFGADPHLGGVYIHDGEGLTIAADGATPQPGGMGNLATFIIQPMSFDRGQLVFRSGNDDEANLLLGLYRSVGDGTVERIVDTSDIVPNGAMQMTYIGVGAARDGRVALVGSDGNPNFTEESLFIVSLDDGSIDVLATLDTAVPGGTGSFKLIGEPEFDGRHVAFLGIDQADRRALYSDITGELVEVVGQGDSIDGKTVAVNLLSPTISYQAIDRYGIAFICSFTDMTNGIYLASYPPIPGDVDLDFDVDLADAAALMNCFTSSIETTLGPECRPADTNGETDVDLGDYRNASFCLAGPEIAPLCFP